MQKEGYKGLTSLGMVENDKKTRLEPLSSSIEREKVEKLLKKWVWTRERHFFKNSLHDFRSVENASIDPTPIEHHSKQIETHKHF